MKKYAPISISVYDREQHLRQCITSLLRNPEASKTVLYLFSDAPQPGHEDKITRVRNYIRTITGFAEIRAIFQTENSYARNMKEAREIPLKDFGRLIRMEDDIIVSPCFLAYMNTALDRFEHDTRIFGISAYAPNFSNPQPDTAFLSKDFSAWGYATWDNRDFPSIVNRTDYYSKIIKNPEARRAAKRLHPLMLPMLRLIEQGKMNPGDYKLSANQFLSNTYSLKPGKSLISNIGFDGLGMNGRSPKTTRFDTEYAHSMPKIPDQLEYDITMDQALFEVYFPKNNSEIRRAAIKLKFMSFIPLFAYPILRRLIKGFR